MTGLWQLLRRHLSDRKIVLRRDAEGIRDAIEEGEHRRDIDGFGNLLFFPAGYSKLFDIFRGSAVSRFGNQFHVVHENALSFGQASLVELSFQDRSYTFIGGSLNPQEVSVAVQSIRTAVQVGDIAGNHLFVTAGEMAFGKMDGVRKLNNLPQEIGPRAETFDDSRHLLTPGPGPPVVIGSQGFSGGFCIFNDLDLGSRLHCRHFRSRIKNFVVGHKL